MVSFHNVRLPEDVEQGAEGGPEFKTTVLSLSSGFEKRNVEWERVRGSWDVAYGIRLKEDIEEVTAFFYARQGKAYGFRFKDWSDYEITGPQTIAIGDGVETIFQVIKQYISGAFAYNRKLTRIVNGTLLVYVNAVLQTEGVDYTVDYDTGLITFSSPPTDTHLIAVTCEFDVPVRFDTDKFNVRMHHEDAMEVPNLPIVELKE